VVIGNIDITSKIYDCTECAHSLPFLPKPILQYSSNAALILIGQGLVLKLIKAISHDVMSQGKGYAFG
jgi:hypothetical protein